MKIPGVTPIPMRLENRSSGRQILGLVKPDVVIYAAGSNDVEWSERNPKDTEKVHTAGAGSVSMVSELSTSRLIYLSNSYVFDGGRGNFHETDVTLPGSYLGKCKLGGENFIRGKSVNHLVLRLSPVIGRGNGLQLTFLDQLRIALSRGQRLTLSSNEIHSFVPITTVVDVIGRLVEGSIKNRVFHYGGLTKLSFVDFAKRFAKRFGFDPSLIMTKNSMLSKGSTEDGQPRPVDLSLNSSQLIEALKIKPHGLEEIFTLFDGNLKK